MARFNKKWKSLQIDIETTESVRLSDFIGNIDDEDILEECLTRGLTKTKPFEVSRESLSDYFGKSRFTSVPELLRLVQGKLESE